MVRRVTDPELGYDSGTRVMSRIETLSDSVGGQELVVLSHDGPEEFVATFKKFLESLDSKELRDFREVVKSWGKARLEFLRTSGFPGTKKPQAVTKLKAEDPLLQLLKDRKFVDTDLRMAFERFKKSKKRR